MYRLSQKPGRIRRWSGAILGVFLLSAIAAHRSEAFGVDIHVSEKYQTVKAGDRLYYEVSIQYPENTARKDLRFTYEVSQQGKIVASAKFLKAVENQASFVDFISIPDDVESGPYDVSVNVTDYGTLDADASASFRVEREANMPLIYFCILLAIVVIFFVLVMLQIRRLRLMR